MSKGYFRDSTCSFKVKIDLNKDGNIWQPGDVVGGSKNITFGGFASTIPASEAVNDENSSALQITEIQGSNAVVTTITKLEPTVISSGNFTKF